jgi:recombination protein RecR
MQGEKSIDNLLEQLEKLPGIGPKSASRIAYFLMNDTKGDAKKIADSILDVKQNVSFCKECFNYSRSDLCEICSNPLRDHSQICVVAQPKNIPVIERTGAYKGLYHVLGAQLSPLDGIGPDDIRINELINRVKNEGVKEVVLATDPNIEGETTANYISKKLKGEDVKVTRLARGIPFGGELEFTDEMTLAQAFDDRKGI